MFLPELEQARVRLHVGPRDCGDVCAGLSVERLEPTELIALLCKFGGKLAHAGAFIGHEMDFTGVWRRRGESKVARWRRDVVVNRPSGAEPRLRLVAAHDVSAACVAPTALCLR